MQQEKELLEREGYLILKDFFLEKDILKLRTQAENIFKIQFKRFGYKKSFKENMIQLFNEQLKVFINCGKIIQTGLIELYKLPFEDRLIQKIKDLGLIFPNLCTRPVLYFNHPMLAKKEVYYKTPVHQDWSSMESSLDSIVIWVPLVDVDIYNGTLVVWPKSHKKGQLTFQSEEGFAKVDYEGKKIRPKLKMGDIIIFSTFLVHASGDILDDSIRWSCHFRYTNMLDQNFIERGFPNPYIYKSNIKKN